MSAVVAILVWHKYVADRRCIVFVDNEGTKFSLLKARSDNDTVDKIVERFANFESETSLITWISRVASKSNIADPPSRGEVDALKASGAEDDTYTAIKIVHDICTKL